MVMISQAARCWVLIDGYRSKRKRGRLLYPGRVAIGHDFALAGEVLVLIVFSIQYSRIGQGEGEPDGFICL